MLPMIAVYSRDLCYLAPGDTALGGRDLAPHAGCWAFWCPHLAGVLSLHWTLPAGMLQLAGDVG